MNAYKHYFTSQFRIVLHWELCQTTDIYLNMTTHKPNDEQFFLFFTPYTKVDHSLLVKSSICLLARSILEWVESVGYANNSLQKSVLNFFKSKCLGCPTLYCNKRAYSMIIFAHRMNHVILPDSFKCSKYFSIQEAIQWNLDVHFFKTSGPVAAFGCKYSILATCL